MSNYVSTSDALQMIISQLDDLQERFEQLESRVEIVIKHSLGLRNQQVMQTAKMRQAQRISQIRSRWGVALTKAEFTRLFGDVDVLPSEDRVEDALRGAGYLDD